MEEEIGKKIEQPLSSMQFLCLTFQKKSLKEAIPDFYLTWLQFKLQNYWAPLRFYFHDELEQLKTVIHTNFRSDWFLGLVIDYPWISKL